MASNSIPCLSFLGAGIIGINLKARLNCDFKHSFILTTHALLTLGDHIPKIVHLTARKVQSLGLGIA